MRMNCHGGVSTARRNGLRFFLVAPLLGYKLAWSVSVVDAISRPSMAVSNARGVVLLGLARAGNRAVAVGERGVILISDDNGVSWRQAKVPVSTTLAAVQFVDERVGWATGHSGVVLTSGDGGETWHLQLDGRNAAKLALDYANSLPASVRDEKLLKEAQRLVDDGPDKPFLALHFSNRKEGFVVGAYGLIFKTLDGGESWMPLMDRLENDRALHLNSIAVQGNSILLAGEQGLLLFSADAGKTFVRLESPYLGSWFSVIALSAEKWLLAGLKGNIFVLGSNGFKRSQVPIPVSIGNVVLMRDGRLLALNQSGQALWSADQGETWKALAFPPGPPLTDILELDGKLLATSFRGIREFPYPQ